MSWKHTKEVWRIKGLTSTQKLVLACLAYHANDAGDCFPKLATLAGETGLTVKSVSLACGDLEGRGLVRRRRSRNGNSYTVYRGGEDFTEGKAEILRDVKRDVHAGCNGVLPSVKAGITEGKIFIGKMTVKETDKLPAAGGAKEKGVKRDPVAEVLKAGEREGFDRFWAAYPKKTGKLDAAKAYRKALRYADEEALVGAVAWWKEKRWANLEDDKYIPYPSVWLNKGRYGDVEEAEAAAVQEGQGRWMGEAERERWLAMLEGRGEG